MVSINYATREVSCKIVYYGPGLSGKTTNLQYETKGKLISLATDADRTLYFDFLPINIGTINGFAAKFQLYTVPGQVYYNATRKLVLRGVDGLVFVADSQRDKMDENIESLNNLKENLAEYGYNINELPIVIQWNKQDLPGVMAPEELRARLNPMGWPEYSASATEGFGVFDTLKRILKMVLDHAKTGGSVPSSRPQPAAPQQQRPAPPPQPTPASAQPSPQTPAQPVPQTATMPPQQPAPATPQREAYAPAAQHVPQQQPPMPQPSQPIPQQQYPQQPPPPQPQQAPPPQPTQSYRPFPGNSAEDERYMQQSASPVQPATSHPVTPPQATGSADSEHSTPAGTSPATQPTDAEQPKKKRGFFKRLFGMK